MREKNTIYSPPSMGQLQWSCRRGMLELDVLLGNFLKECYLQLSLENQEIFIRLINYSDPELFAWLIDYQIPEDEELKQMTERIRSHAQSRIQA